MSNVATLLKEAGKYLEKKDLQIIQKAYEFSKKAHKDQKRKSGVPYITHPVATARILVKLHLDRDTIVAALLHDVPEDTHFTLNDIKRQFGEKVSFLVNGITKMSTVYYRLDMQDRQIESLKKLMIHCAQDSRVVLIKLADRLHNMQTLHFLDPHKRTRIAQETKEIYVPIANLLGIGSIKTELEDLCFKHLHSTEHEQIEKKVQEITKKNARILEESIRKIKRSLKNEDIACTVRGRQKNLFSIYKKIKKNQSYFSAIEDIIGIRVILKTKQDCYAALGHIHSLFKPKPRRFKDYIAVPKTNGYQSIHTTVFGINGIVTEIQIRSEEMDLEAQYGIAAHYFYKHDEDDNLQQQEWAQKILEIQKSVHSNADLIENLKLDVFQDRIFVFTPKGDVIDLPSGATGIDFAFTIHSEIGKRAEKLEVNGETRSLFSTLNTGDTIKVIINQSKKAQPTIQWLQHCKTNTAKKNIKEYLTKQTKKKKCEAGKTVLKREFGKLDRTFDELTHRDIAVLLKHFNERDVKELYIKVGEGNVTPHQITDILVRHWRKPSFLQKMFSSLNMKSKATIGFIVKSENLPMQVTKIIQAINELRIPIVKLKTRAKQHLTVKIICRKVDEEVTEKIFDKIEQIDGILSIRRTFPLRIAYFYGWGAITAILWGITPLLIQYVAQAYGTNEYEITHQLILYGGIAVLFGALFHLRRIFYKSFPELRETRFFWISSFLLVTAALSAIIGEIIFFDLKQLNWIGILGIITLVYAITISEYINYYYEK